jgi:putative transposase
MENFTKDIVAALAQKQDISEVFRIHLEAAVNELMQNELSSYLGYEPYDRSGFNSGNSRNGQYYRTFKTRYGELNLAVPRDRQGLFKTKTLPSYQRQSDILEDTIIHLYQKGITTTEIAELIKKMYGQYYTKQTISNLTKAVDKQVTAFKERQLASKYAVVYLDATYIPLKRGTVSKEAVYLAIGIQPNGHKDVIGYTIAPTESTTVWKELLISLKQHGLKQVLLFVTDGLNGLSEAIMEIFPDSKYQQCLVHISRKISSHVRIKDRHEIMQDFKEIHNADNLTEGQRKMDEFINKWAPKYRKLMNSLSVNPNLLTWLMFPRPIRASIYSTNLIESFNKKLKRNIKKREQFPNEESLERNLVSVIFDYNSKFGIRSHKGFKSIEDTLESMF